MKIWHLFLGCLLFLTPCAGSLDFDFIFDNMPKIIAALSGATYLSNQFTEKNSNTVVKSIPMVLAGTGLVGGVLYLGHLYRKTESWKTNPRISPENKEQIKAILSSSWLSDPSNRLRYLKWVSKFPFGQRTKTTFLNLSIAQQILDDSHTGLFHIKQAIFDYIAALKINGDGEQKIICFEGLPGTGKTSLSLSIAKALNKKSCVIHLNGKQAKDLENSNWDGPGLLAKALIEAQTTSPVIIFDEVDKADADILFALLSIFDPAQNRSILDKYLNISMDLSKVTFILTANDLSRFPEALKERMHIIRTPAYTIAERIDIGLTKLVPQIMDASKLPALLTPHLSKLIRPLVDKLIIAEAGVRLLRRGLVIAAEKYARQIIEQEERAPTIGAPLVITEITPESILSQLDPNLLNLTNSQEAKPTVPPGITNILWFGEHGVGTQQIEVVLLPNGSGKLLKDPHVGSQARQIQSRALSYVKLNAHKHGITQDFLSTHDVMIGDHWYQIMHGSGIGLGMAVALISAYTNRKTKPNFAFAGCIDMHGNVLGFDFAYAGRVFNYSSRNVNNIILPLAIKPVVETFKSSFPDITVWYVSSIEEAVSLVLEDKAT